MRPIDADDVLDQFCLPDVSEMQYLPEGGKITDDFLRGIMYMRKMIREAPELTVDEKNQ